MSSFDIPSLPSSSQLHLLNLIISSSSSSSFLSSSSSLNIIRHHHQHDNTFPNNPHSIVILFIIIIIIVIIIIITIPITTLPLHTWHDGLLAGGALGGVLVGVAFGTQELVFLHGEGLLHQRAAALGTLEALLMPVAVFVGEVLSVSEVSLHFTGGW